MLPGLLHGEEKKVRGDAGYQGHAEAIHAAAPEAQDMTSRRVKTEAGVDEAEKRKNRTKARVRAKVEWPFRILKRVFGFTKVRYRGLKEGSRVVVRSLRAGQPTRTANGWPFKGRSAPAGGRASFPAGKNKRGSRMKSHWFSLGEQNNRSRRFITRRFSKVPC
jgi:hypothetical protein